MDTAGNEGEKELHSATKQLMALFELASVKVTNFVSQEDFTEAYKKVFVGYSVREGEEVPLCGSSKEAKKLRDNFNSFILEDIRSSFDAFMKEADLDRKLRELDQLKTACSASQNIQAWRPPGNARKHMEPFNVVSKLEEKSRLEAAVAKEREQLNTLKATAVEMRKVAVSLDAELEAKQEIMERALKSLSHKGEQLNTLKATAVEMRKVAVSLDAESEAKQKRMEMALKSLLRKEAY